MKKTLLTLLGLGLLAVLTVGLNRALGARASAAETSAPKGEAAQAGAGGASAPRLVTVARLEPVDGYDVPRRFTGEFRARRAVDLAFDGTGRVDQMLVDEGDRVSEGQLLGSLDTALLEARRAQLESQRARLEAQLEELVKGPREETIEAARAEVDALQQDLLLAEGIRDRREALVGTGSIGPEEAETARTQVKRLAATLAGAEARLAELANGTRSETIAAQAGAIDELDAALQTLTVEIENTRLVAPFAGTVALRRIDEGTFVSSMAPAPALRLVESSVLELRVGLPPALARSIESGASTPRATFNGRALELSRARALPELDAATRTVPMLFDVGAPTAPAPSPAEMPRPGDLAEVELRARVDERGAWVPLAALTTSARGLWSLFTLDASDSGAGEARVRRALVEVLRTDGERAFVRGTFDGPLEFIEDGQHRVVPGQVVRLAPASRAED